MLQALYNSIKRRCKLHRVRKAMHMNRNCLCELDSLMRAIAIDCSTFEIVDVTQMFSDDEEEDG